MNKFLDVISLTVFFMLVFPLTAKAVGTLGEATYYSSSFENSIMANGKAYKSNNFTCASVSHRLGTMLRVTNVNNKKSVIVKVTDRGNFSHRDVDLSLRAFESLAPRSVGRIRVKIEVIK